MLKNDKCCQGNIPPNFTRLATETIVHCEKCFILKLILSFIRLLGYQTFFMLNSTELEIYHAHEC